MKSSLIFCIAFALLISCGNNKAAEEKTASKPAERKEVADNTETKQATGNDIAGYWKLILEAYDNNGNKNLDEEERKRGIKNKYSFRFNADGSCQIREMFKGHYEVKAESNSKMLYVYRKKVEGEEDKDPAPDVYRIVTLSKDQLVLLEREGNLTFWVFERAV